MKTLIPMLLFSMISYAATAPQEMRTSAASSASKYEETKTKTSKRMKTKEPSAIPCGPQQTQSEKLDDLAKMEGEGESHSTNCPAQGAIKDTPGEKETH